MGGLLGRYGLLAVAVLVLNFALPRLLPGDPLEAEAPDGTGGVVSTLTVETRAQLRAQYRLDRPPLDQLAGYLGDLSRGDLGWSISRSAPVGPLVAERLPWTLALVVLTAAIAGVGGTLLGMVAAWRGGRLGLAIVSVSAALAAVPEFLVAMALLALVAGAEWLPLPGGQTTFPAAPAGLLDRMGLLGEAARSLALPTLALVLASSAAFVLLARGATQAVQAEPYLATARAKGLSETEVALRHALPNALLPILALLGVRVGQMLGGAIVVERVFALPGLGRLTFEAIRARDYPVLQAVFLLSSLGMLVSNLVVDLAYRWLEPRHGER